MKFQFFRMKSLLKMKKGAYNILFLKNRCNVFKNCLLKMGHIAFERGIWLN